MYDSEGESTETEHEHGGTRALAPWSVTVRHSQQKHTEIEQDNGRTPHPQPLVVPHPVLSSTTPISSRREYASTSRGHNSIFVCNPILLPVR